MKRLKLVPIAGLLVGLAGCARHHAPAVYYGVEGSKLSAIWATDKLAPDAAMFQSEHVHAGRGALKNTIHPDDPTPEIFADDTERDELTVLHAVAHLLGLGNTRCPLAAQFMQG